MFSYTVSFFDKLMRRYTPDPYVLAILITVVVFFMGLWLTPATVRQMILYWGGDFWSLIPFTLQMCMVLVGGYAAALSPPIDWLLRKAALWGKTDGQAIIITTLVAAISSYLNWGLGLVVGGLMCRKIVACKPNINFPLLVASAYSGFLTWHGGLSGSIPLMLATEGSFSQQWIGGTIAVSQTLFAEFNIAAVVGLLFLLPCMNYTMNRFGPGPQVYPISSLTEVTQQLPASPAERLEHIRLVPWTISLFAFFYLYYSLTSGTFRLDINMINFIFLFLAIVFYGRIHSFLQAINEAVAKLGPMLIQYPLYAGIMGMIAHSNLTEVISNWFISVSTAKTFPLFTFLSAGFINLFVPSGGGQWALQAPIVIQAAKTLGVNIPLASMAVAWGDAWTNLLQPFWALPLVAIAGLKLRDIMGYCVCLLLISGLFLSLVFYLAS